MTVPVPDCRFVAGVCALAAASLLICGEGAAQLVFPSLPAVPAPGAPRTMATGDFSGDGRVDLAVTSTSTGRIRLLLLDEDGELGEGALIPVGSEPAALFAADFDGDLDLDLAWTDLRSGDVGVILFSPGNPPGWQVLRQRGPDEPSAVIVADLDADQSPDLLAAHGGADELVLYPNQGGTPGAGVPSPAGDRPDRLLLLEHPGGPTVALRQSGRLSRNVQLTSLDGATRTEVALPGGGEIFSVDVDGDGAEELLVVEEDVGEVSVRAHAGGAWTETQRFAVDDDVCGIAAAEVGPGQRRLAVGSRGRRRVALYAVGPGTIVRESNWYAGGGMGDVLYQDVDGDGAPEVVVAQATMQRLQVMPPLGAGLFAERAPSAPAGGLSITNAEDVDGHRLLAVSGSAAGQVGVYRLEGPDPGEPILLAAADGVRAARFAQLDGTAGLDLASVARTGGLRVHLSDGAGGFVAAGGFVPAGQIGDLDFVDVVGGPALDLVLARLDPPALVVHEGLGNGSFQSVPAAQVTTSEPLVVVRTHDLDLDGRKDVVGLGFDSVLTIFLNRAGQGLAGVDLVVNNAPRDVGFGRFNSDAWPDMITINEGSADFTVVTSVLPGVYTVGVRGTPTLPGASRLEVADYDLDGVDDFCVTAVGLRSVGIHVNSGTAAEPLTRFSPPLQFELCESPVDLAVADLDGDGRPDLIGLDGEADVVAVRLSDPFADVAGAFASIEVEVRPEGRTVHVHSDAAYAHDLRLTRQPGNALLALVASGPGRFDAFDPALLDGEATYVVRDRQGTELDRIDVASRVATGAPADHGPVLLPALYEGDQVRLRLRAPQDVRPELRIYDLRGRRVARLELQEQGDGWFEGIWAGTDSRGRSVSRGRYLVRASLGPVVRTGSVLVR